MKYKLEIKNTFFARISILTILIFAAYLTYGQAIPVEIVTNNDKTFTLLRGGEPYYIYGGAGANSGLMDELVAKGGNSTRTWGVDVTTKNLLDAAYSKGISVMLGLWAGHEKDGFDYNNATRVANQLASFRAYVRLYKDHPAVLAWAIGNEVEVGYSNTKVWDAINDISKMIHEEDVNHPTLTVTASANSTFLNLIATKVPDLDFIGINQYGGISGIPSGIQNSEWSKPYVITEWGVNGPWESGKTSWGAYLEMTSHEKATLIQSRYQSYIAPNEGKNLGSYAFLWGSKTEGTKTWFGLFVGSESTEMVDVLQKSWTGANSSNLAPQINNITLNNKVQEQSVILESSTGNVVQIEVTDPDGDELEYEYLVVPESGTDGIKYIPGATFSAIPGIVTEQNGNTANLEFKEGQNYKNYRLYTFVRDGHGHVATASFPFRTELIDLGYEEWIISPTEDSYIRNGQYSNFVYGNTDSEVLEVMNSSVSGSSRQTYLRFDLNPAPSKFSKAILEIYGKSTDVSQIFAYAITKKNWDETSLNWNNKFEAQTGLLAKTEIGTESKWYSFDLSKYIAGQFTNNVRDITFILKGYEKINDPGTFNSKENSSNQPKLRIYNGTPTGIQDVALKQISVYPNPVSDVLVVKEGADFHHPVFVEVFSMTGQKFFSQEMSFVSGELRINISSLPDNLYVLRILGKNGLNFNSKFIKTGRR